MDSLRRLEEIFAHFPGIGPRQARRFVYYLLNKSPASIKEFTDLVAEVKKSTHQCAKCHRFFIQKQGERSNEKGGSLCSICGDPSRDRTTLMVVARDSDFESIERSGAYKGLYFILGGTVPILDKEPEKRVRLKLFLERLSADSANLKEVILSLNTTPDGEHTESILRDAYAKMTKNSSVLPGARLTILGRGLSTGAELEYADGETIRNALANRR